MSRNERNNGLQSHHILFDRVSWSARPDSKLLRGNNHLIPDIDAESHKELHKSVPAVPLIGFHALRRTVKYFEPVENDPLSTMDELMSAMEQSARDVRSHEIERQLVYLAVQAIDLQKPFIRSALPTDDTVIDLGAYRKKRVSE